MVKGALWSQGCTHGFSTKDSNMVFCDTRSLEHPIIIIIINMRPSAKVYWTLCKPVNASLTKLFNSSVGTWQEHASGELYHDKAEFPPTVSDHHKEPPQPLGLKAGAKPFRVNSPVVAFMYVCAFLRSPVWFRSLVPLRLVVAVWG